MNFSDYIEAMRITFNTNSEGYIRVADPDRYLMDALEGVQVDSLKGKGRIDCVDLDGGIIIEYPDGQMKFYEAGNPDIELLGDLPSRL